MKKLLLILCIVLCSCGARKSEVHKSETESRSETAIQQQNDVVTEVKTETITESEAETLIITPIDNTRPIEIIKPDGSKTTITNGRIEKKKEKQETKQNTAAKATDKSTVDVKHTEEAKTVTKDKKTDRKESYGWIIWIGIALLILWFIYRKIKKRATILK